MSQVGAGVPAGREEWAGRFEAQSAACGDLGSGLYRRLLLLLADEVRSGGPTWEVLAPHASLRFGQAGPLRLVGAAHRLALLGDAPRWASVLPSCGGAVPDRDDDLAAAWADLVARHGTELSEGLTREVQTNEVARAAGLALGIAASGVRPTRLVELGCSGGLNLHLDRFRIELSRPGASPVALGPPSSPVRLTPELLRAVTTPVRMGPVEDRVGLDVAPIDPCTDAGAATLVGFVWPDQPERIARVRGAIELATAHPARLLRTDDPAADLEGLLADAVPTVVQQSIVWQYVPTAVRWRVTSAIEAAGDRATRERPLGWVRIEPDEWNRTRAALWVRTWPGGADRLVAHVDYHGRWIAPVGGRPGAEG